MKRLLTIQDISCVGQCSTTVALPLVSACGVECAVLPPAILSNHTGGFKTWSFADLTGELGKVEAKWIEQGIRFDAFYTGYVCENHIDPILSIMETCANDGALRFVDPAMADNGVLYTGFADDFPSKMARLCKGADYLLPNLTEAALLLEREPVLEGYDEVYIEKSLFELKKLGCKIPMITGVSFEKGKIGVAFLENDRVSFVFSKKYDGVTCGTGDVLSSVLFGALLSGAGTAKAVSKAVSAVEKAIKVGVKNYGIDFECLLCT